MAAAEAVDEQGTRVIGAPGFRGAFVKHDGVAIGHGNEVGRRAKGVPCPAQEIGNNGLHMGIAEQGKGPKRGKVIKQGSLNVKRGVVMCHGRRQKPPAMGAVSF